MPSGCWRDTIEKVIDPLAVDLSQPKGNVVSLPLVSAESSPLGYTRTTARKDTTERDVDFSPRIQALSGE